MSNCLPTRSHVAAYLLVDRLIDLLATRLHRTARPADLFRRQRRAPPHEPNPPLRHDIPTTFPLPLPPLVLFEPRPRVGVPLADGERDLPPDPTPPPTTHNTLARPTRLPSFASTTASATVAATASDALAPHPAAPRTVSSPALDPLIPLVQMPMPLPFATGFVVPVSMPVPISISIPAPAAFPVAVPVPVSAVATGLVHVEVAPEGAAHTPAPATGTIATTIASVDELLPTPTPTPTRDELLNARLTLRALVLRRDELEPPPPALAPALALTPALDRDELRTPPLPLFALERPPRRHTLRARLRRVFSNVLPFLRSLLL